MKRSRLPRTLNSEQRHSVYQRARFLMLREQLSRIDHHLEFGSTIDSAASLDNAKNVSAKNPELKHYMQDLGRLYWRCHTVELTMLAMQRLCYSDREIQEYIVDQGYDYTEVLKSLQHKLEAHGIQTPLLKVE